ncbi:50S ribosomal protein L27-like [Gossypium australe]|uniref:50S ribosomal protein L27-like n=1 Tax=Gossypium australe TaxID=47621 RepID=A0A5B6VD86_9ROSI|nr:50S ribosomal protein L27-like [Gossypium australe]
MENGFNGNNKKMGRKVSDESLANDENNGRGSKARRTTSSMADWLRTFFEAEAKIEEINGLKRKSWVIPERSELVNQVPSPVVLRRFQLVPTMPVVVQTRVSNV